MSSKQVPELPLCWAKMFSKTWQRHYYFNVTNGTAQWDLPKVQEPTKPALDSKAVNECSFEKEIQQQNSPNEGTVLDIPQKKAPMSLSQQADEVAKRKILKSSRSNNDKERNVKHVQKTEKSLVISVSKNLVQANQPESLSTSSNSLELRKAPTRNIKRKSTNSLTDTSSCKEHDIPIESEQVKKMRPYVKSMLEEKKSDQSCIKDEHIEDEKMDYETYVVKEVINQVSAVRSSLVESIAAIGALTKSAFAMQNNNRTDERDLNKNILHIVIDTNIFLEELNQVNDLINQTFKDREEVHIVIPWTVLQELDSIKDNRNKKQFMFELQAKARAAVKFLNVCLENKHPRVEIQVPQVKTTNRRITIACNDDKILHCVFEWAEKYPKSYIVLLTLDVNLRNKAMVLGIKAIDVKSLQKLEQLQRTSSIIKNTSVQFRLANSASRNNRLAKNNLQQFVDAQLCNIRSLLEPLLNTSLRTEMIEVYDKLWTDIIYKKPPWTFVQLLQCFEKHWIAVFGMVLRRDRLSDVQHLLSIFKLPVYGLELDMVSLKKVMDSALNLCEALQLRESYKEEAVKVYKAISDLAKKGDEKNVNCHKNESKNDSSTPVEHGTYTCITSHVAMNVDSGAASIDERVMNVFQKTWEAIVHNRHTIRNQLVTNLDRSNCIHYFTRLCVAVAKIHLAYCRMMSLDPDDSNDQIYFSHLCSALASFTDDFSIICWHVLSPDELRLFYRKNGKREVLQNGLVQLEQILTGIMDMQKTLLSANEVTHITKACQSVYEA